MPPALPDYPRRIAGHSGGGLHAFIVGLTDEPATMWRIAYAGDRSRRWKISGRMSERFAREMLSDLQREVAKGNPVIALQHRLRTHQRDTIRFHLKAHRRRLHERMEMNMMRHQANFGIF